MQKPNHLRLGSQAVYSSRLEMPSYLVLTHALQLILQNQILQLVLVVLIGFLLSDDANGDRKKVSHMAFVRILDAG